MQLYSREHRTGAIPDIGRSLSPFGTGTVAILVFAFVWCLAAPGIASAEGRRVVLRPPYERTIRISSISVATPCQVVTPQTQRDTTSSDPTTGRISGNIGLWVYGCTSMSHGFAEVWRLGRTPKYLVGKPGHVTLLISRPRIHVHSGGALAHARAEVVLRLGETDKAVAGISCKREVCTVNDASGRHSRRFLVVDAVYDSFPAHIDLMIDQYASVAGGSGSVSAQFTGVLSSVVVRSTEK